jgi:diguanylate cyclase (GGDEF)-like protein/PAS domain S-box-containing protein
MQNHDHEIADRDTRPVILIVDDVRSNQEILVSLLKNDYRVKVAGNGQRALEIAACMPHPDLILLDVQMPEMDGYEVCRRLRQNPKTRDISVIFVTAASDVQSEANGLMLGAVDYISKPISATVTLLRVRNHLLLKQAMDGLRLTAKVFETTMESIIVTDAQSRIIDVNPAFCRMTGYTRDEVLGRTPAILHSGYHDKRVYSDIWQQIDSAGYWSGELWNLKKNGDIYPELICISAISNAQGMVTHYVGIASDISQQKQYEKQLERTAHYDALTGIPNRVLLSDRMKQAIARTKRDQNLMGVCYLDLDGFKPVNDSCGHLAGDQVLVEIARRISGELRECDTVARLGGDEFVVLLPGLHQESECVGTVGRILSIIAQPVLVQDRVFSLTASIGVTVFPSDNNDPDLLLRHADQAMYRAKQSGKNRFNFYDPSYAQQNPAHEE